MPNGHESEGERVLIERHTASLRAQLEVAQRELALERQTARELVEKIQNDPGAHMLAHYWADAWTDGYQEGRNEAGNRDPLPYPQRRQVALRRLLDRNNDDAVRTMLALAAFGVLAPANEGGT